MTWKNDPADADRTNSKILPDDGRKRNKKRSQWSGSRRQSVSLSIVVRSTDAYSDRQRVNCPDDSKQDPRKKCAHVSLSEWKSCQKDDDPVERRIWQNRLSLLVSERKKEIQITALLVTACSHSCRSWKERKKREEEESVWKRGGRGFGGNSSRCLNSSSSIDRFPSSVTILNETASLNVAHMPFSSDWFRFMIRT